MEVQLNYGRLKRSEHIENWVAEEMEFAVKKINSSRVSQITIWLDSENPPSSAGPSEYKCTVSFRTVNNEVFVQKKHQSLRQCIRQSRQALVKQLRRKREKRLSGRKKIDKYELAAS